MCKVRVVWSDDSWTAPLIRAAGPATVGVIEMRSTAGGKDWEKEGKEWVVMYH